MDKKISLFRMFMFKGSENFIRNEVQELHWQKVCGDPNHYYEQAYKDRIDLDFLIKHGHASSKDLKYPVEFDGASAIVTNSFSVGHTGDNSSQRQRVMVYFNVTGMVRLRLTEEELRLLKIKDYEYYSTFYRFK